VEPQHVIYLYASVGRIRRDREAAAADWRRARVCRGARRRPSVALRLYARLWWASRPRAAAWTPGLFGPHSA
jgi:hypothetical protein